MKYLTKNRHIVYFDKNLVENYDKVYLGNGHKLILTIGNSRAEYSVEEAYIHNSCEKFFEDGDRVLISYDVFRLGKYPELAKGEEKRVVGFDENGNELYWARPNQVVAKFKDGKWVPKEGWVLVKAPEPVKEEKVGLIIIPHAVKSVERQKNKEHWSEVVYSNSDVVKEKSIVLIARFQYLPFDSIGLLAVQEDNLLAVKN